MPVIKVSPVDRRNRKTIALGRKRNNIFSQNGEDGIIAEIFNTIGAQNKWCVEFGAWDGIHLSNTCNLIRNEGWSGVLIEGDVRKFKDLENNFKDRNDVYPVNRMIGYSRGVDTIDDALAGTPIPKDFDLISIDIDGNDWHIWESIEAYRPRVVVIEVNPTIPNDVYFVQDRDMRISQGTSFLAMNELAKDKGYELVAVTNFNGIYVVKEEYDKFDIEDNSLDAFRISPSGRIFAGYDGTVFNTLGRMKWNGRALGEVPVDALQALPDEKRGYTMPHTK